MKKLNYLVAGTILLNSTFVGTIPALAKQTEPHSPGKTQESVKPGATKNTDAVAVAGKDADADIVHILNRIAFGPRPGDIEHVRQIGIQKYVEEQLNPQNMPDLVAGDPRFQTMHESAAELITEFQNRNKMLQNAKKNDNFSEEERDAAKRALKQFYDQTQGAYKNARLERAINSPRQLEEVLTDFWYNHFNIFGGKNLDTVLCGPYEQQAIRPFVLGRFRDILGATCHHPAMLFYLDNWQNTAPKAPGARGRFTGLNENYARELMELHTLGVDGGYSQKDVTELARVLTGLSIPGRQANRNPNLQSTGPFGAVFDSSRHDYGTKVVLGKRISGTGEAEIEECLDMLARQPATAHHIAFQLAQYFVADVPPPQLVNKLAQRFQQTDGNIKDVMQTLLGSPEFWDPKYEHCKYKSPFRYVISSIRATGASIDRLDVINQFLKMQGQPLYGCLTPDGYKNVKDAWMNPDALLRRINFATAIGYGSLPGMNSSPPEYRQLGATISAGKFSNQTVATVAKQPEQLRSALLIGSPEFMRY
jgi:uncharacterized protein (DUF1800 family)